MKFTNNGKAVENIKHRDSFRNLKIDWDPSGYKFFIVVSAPHERDINLVNNNTLQAELKALGDKLVAEKQASGQTTEFYLVSYSDLMKNGGLQINKKPGYQTVYGCDVVSGSITDVYCADSEKVKISINLEITQENAYIIKRKCFFSKKQKKEYSGYKKITVLKGVEDLEKNSVKYIIPQSKAISFPDCVIKNGGSFYVRCNENESVKIEPSNDGITII